MTVHRPFYLLENCDKSNSRYCRLPITRQCEIGTLGVNLFLQPSLSEVISLSICPAAGQGFQNTPCPAVRIFLMSS